MRVLGIDPGTAIMGYGVIEGGPRPQALAFDALLTPPDVPMPQRLQSLYRGLESLFSQWHPDLLAVEELFFGRNVTTAISVGQARGLVLLAAANAGVPVAEYTPGQVKQAVTGYGKADKTQVQAMVCRLLGLSKTPKPDDVADALAVALCGYNAWPLEQRLAKLTASGNGAIGPTAKGGRS